MILVAAADDAYAMPLAVTLWSALRHLSGLSPEIYLLDGGVSTENRARLDRVIARASQGRAVVQWIVPAPCQIDRLQGARHLSRSTYLRIIIPDLLPASMDRAIYLDSDLLVVSNLTPLWEQQLNGKALGVVQDYAIPTIDHPYSGVMPDLHGSPPADSFNAGVMLFDLSRWRANGISSKVLDYAEKYDGRLGNCDQDALNAILQNDWQTLDRTWNVQSSLLYLHVYPHSDAYVKLLADRPFILRDARIIHFSGTPKPWNHWHCHPYCKNWVYALMSSGWFSKYEISLWSARWVVKRGFFFLKVLAGKQIIRERTYSETTFPD